MPEFRNKEEYEKWKAVKVALHETKARKDSQDSRQSNESEQTNDVKKNVDIVLLKSTRIIKTKLFGVIGLFLLIITPISSYIVFKDVNPEKIFSLNKKAVVLITTYNLLGETTGGGSGFILAADGVVATNLHVIKNAANISIKTTDDRILNPIGVLHIDENNDIALIKIKVKENVELFKVKIGNPQKLVVGEKIYALGNPQGIESTFSEGIVSGIREIKSGVKLIQITAPVSPGSSGGPVINRKGKVVGITTFLVEQGQNLNFAYPINLIKTEIDVRKIIYTFPDLKANWKFVSGAQTNDIPFTNEAGYISSQEVSKFYYDPESIVNLGDGVKGFWSKSLTYFEKRGILYGYAAPYREHNEANATLFFWEMDCNTKKTRSKAFFFISDEKQTVVNSDFSSKNTWESLKADSPLDKMSTIVCQSQN